MKLLSIPNTKWTSKLSTRDTKLRQHKSAVASAFMIWLLVPISRILYLFCATKTDDDYLSRNIVANILLRLSLKP